MVVRALRRARRSLLLRGLVRALRLRHLHAAAARDRGPFPRPTDPARLRAVLADARRHVPYYRLHLPPLPPEADPAAAFARLPFRTPKAVVKQDLRQVMDERYLSLEPFDYKGAGLASFRRLLWSDFLVRANTSGTSGAPLEFFRSKSTVFAMFFSILEAMRRLGWREGDAVLSAWQALGPRRPTLVRRALRAVGFPLFTFTRMGEESCRAFLAALEGEAPAALFGFPSYYLECARFLKETGTPLRRPPRLMLCGGEMLLDAQRALLEDAFRAPVYNSYGGNEFGFVACECAHRRGLHVLEHAFVAETGEDGQLLLTTLDQREMPLVKYETGDRAVLADERCPCGVAGRKILSLEGRVEDYLLDGVGRRVFSRYFRETLLDANRRFGDCVVRAQFAQDARRAVRVRLQTMAGAAPPELTRYLEQRVGTDLEVPVSAAFTGQLAPESGKFRFLVREG